ncbi:MAG: OmpA family protein [Catalinimonas sp.]
MNRPLCAPLLVAFALLLTVTSCVTRNKYDRLVEREEQAQLRVEQCDEQLAQTRTELEQRAQALAAAQESNQKLRADTTQVRGELRRQVRVFNDLNDSYERLVANNQRMLSNSASEQNRLAAQLGEREQALLRSEQDLRRKSQEIDSLRNDLRARETRVNELEKVLEEQEAAVNSLRKKVTDALLNFTGGDLTVDIRDGKVYVSVSEKLLFKSGSYSVDSRGAEALRDLAPILKEQTEVGIMVEGHTDNVPIKTAAIRNNWDLSVLRATSIVMLLQDAGVAGARLVAAGRGEYVPVVANTSADNKARNRRTEIILTPKLDDLFNILGNN